MSIMNVIITFEQDPTVQKTITLGEFQAYATYVYNTHHKKNFTMVYRVYEQAFVCKFNSAELFEETFLKFKEAQFHSNLDKLLK